jgi:TonB family protein
VREASEPSARVVRGSADGLARSKGLHGAGVFGMLAREPIRREMARIGPELRACYERSRAYGAAARMVVRFVIEPEGRVPCVEVTESESGDPAMDQCVSESVAGLRFVALGRGAVTVVYPFRFAP